MQLVEARLTWGADLLGVAHLRARREMRTTDFGLPFPEDAAFSLVDLPRTFTDGECTLSLELVEREKPIPAAQSDWRVAKGLLLGFVVHATFLAMAYLGRGSDAELEKAQLETLKAMLDNEAPRRLAVNAEMPTFPDMDEPAGTTGGEEGAMGSPASQKNSGVAARSRGKHPQETDPRPQPAVESFGMIALLSENSAGRNAGNDPWGTFEGPSAMGSIFGMKIDDAIGVGGMGLSNFGEGGGGKGKGVDLEGGMGTCGDGDCAYGLGSIGHIGRASGRLARGHQTRAPVLRCGNEDCSVAVNGRLPPESIQRVVRQNFGRLRGCYESGLHRNPSLEGRIAVKFVIDRSGAVNFASVSERDLQDAEVARCVAMRFQDMTFPQPEGGIVTVTYPIAFSTSP